MSYASLNLHDALISRKQTTRSEWLACFTRKFKELEIQRKRTRGGFTNSLNSTLTTPKIEDLKKLLSYYQLWAHKMFPKTQFSDTIEKVEKICHQRRMEAALKGWKDANDHKRTLELEGGVEIPDNLEREQEMDINIDQNNTTDVGNDDRRSASPALFRSPSPADIPPDEDIEHLQRNDDEATRDALENEALAELEKELGGF